jgi:hypothetical protein
MVVIKSRLASKYKTVLNILTRLNRSAPHDRLRILIAEVRKGWTHVGSPQV